MNWFKELSNSEQKLIKYGTVLVLVALFWVFVYKPINQSIQLKSKQQLTLTQQLKQMESSKKLLKFQNINDTKSHRDINQPFIAWIDSKLLQNKLSQFPFFVNINISTNYYTNPSMTNFKEQLKNKD